MSMPLPSIPPDWFSIHRQSGSDLSRHSQQIYPFQPDARCSCPDCLDNLTVQESWQECERSAVFWRFSDSKHNYPDVNHRFTENNNPPNTCKKRSIWGFLDETILLASLPLLKQCFSWNETLRVQIIIPKKRKTLTSQRLLQSFSFGAYAHQLLNGKEKKKTVTMIN